MIDSKLHTTPFNVAEHLRISEEMVAYLETCFEEAGDDAAFIARALGNIAHAKGVSQITCDSDLSCENLYRALLVELNPSFDTTLRSKMQEICSTTSNSYD